MITKPTNKAFTERFLAAPEPIRELLMSDALSDILISFRGRYMLDELSAETLRDYLNYLLLGFTTPQAFSQALIQELRLPAEKVQGMLGELNERIFVPLREKEIEPMPVEEVAPPPVEVDKTPSPASTPAALAHVAAPSAPTVPVVSAPVSASTPAGTPEVPLAVTPTQAAPKYSLDPYREPIE